MATNQFTYNNHTYLLSNAGTWTSAEAQAVALGGHLVTVNDQAEQDWIRTTFPNNPNLWIGFTDQVIEGDWQWISGENSTYKNWRSGEPTNSPNYHPELGEDYASIMITQSGVWNDIPNSVIEYYGYEPRGIIEINNSVLPSSYKTTTGQGIPEVGTYNYYDETGNQLTDGKLGVNNWQANLGNGAAYEWVGWRTIDPTLDFTFSNSPSTKRVSIGFTRDDQAFITLPTNVTINGKSFPLTGNEVANGTRGVVNFDGDFSGNTINIKLSDGNANNWILVDEVQFSSNSNSSTSTPVINWTNWTTNTKATETGTLTQNNQAITVSYTGNHFNVDHTSAYYGSPFSSALTSATVTTTPGTNGLIQMLGGTQEINTIHFSTPVIDPVIEFISLGNPNLPVNINFQNNPNISLLSHGSGYWGNGDASLNGNVLNGREGNGVVQFKGTYQDISFTAPNSENWYGFTVGANAVQKPLPEINLSSPLELGSVFNLLFLDIKV